MNERPEFCIKPSEVNAMHSKKAAGLAAAVAMFVLILDSKTGLTGAQDGVQLCLETVVPALFPFFLLSSALNRAWYRTNIPILGRLFHMTEGTEILLIPAFLGGYPVGAQSIGQLYRQKQLSKQEAQRLLQFCSNAGPAFLFGMVRTVFSSSRLLWVSWGIQLISALTVAQLSRPHGQSFHLTEQPQVSTDSVLRTSINALAQVCGWVIAFRVAIAFLQRWCFLFLPSWTGILCTGLLELTNGVCSLRLLEDEALRFILCNLFLSWGGLCVVMQTSAVIEGLDLRFYIKGKLIQAAVSTILSLAVTQKAWWVFPFWVGGILLFSDSFAKRSSNQSRVIV